jgi:hypothetical protein
MGGKEWQESTSDGRVKMTGEQEWQESGRNGRENVTGEG